MVASAVMSLATAHAAMVMMRLPRDRNGAHRRRTRSQYETAPNANASATNTVSTMLSCRRAAAGAPTSTTKWRG